MKNDLKEIYHNILEKMNIQKDEDSTVFDGNVFQEMKNLVTINDFCIKKRYHDYDSHYRADSLHFFSNKITYKLLGLAILSIVFHQDCEKMIIKIINENSDIKNLIIKYDFRHDSKGVEGYIAKPFRFEYFFSEIKRFPWENLQLQSFDLPLFFLTNEDESIIKDEDWQNRDTLIITGSSSGLVRISTLLLDMSNSGQVQDEFDLENELGVAGVGHGSAEAKFWLPGSLGWESFF